MPDALFGLDRRPGPLRPGPQAADDDQRRGAGGRQPDVVTTVLSHHAHPREEAALNTRHRAILVLLARGWTEEAIGNHIGLSGRQIRRYVADIYQVLGVTSKVALGAEAVRRGLIA